MIGYFTKGILLASLFSCRLTMPVTVIFLPVFWRNCLFLKNWLARKIIPAIIRVIAGMIKYCLFERLGRS